MKKGKICGIYKITNKINDKIYIGLSVDIEDRWYEHRRDLNAQKHKNRHLQRAWNKYGEDNFIFEIIIECSEEELRDKEKFYINYYDSYHNGYNMTLGGDGTIGRFHSLETRKKISESNKGRKCPNAEQLRKLNHTNKRKIVQLTVEGNIVRVWESLLEINNSFSTDIRNTIKECCDKKPKRLMSKGFVWMWKDEYDTVGFDKTRYLNNRSINRNRRIYCKTLDLYFDNINKVVEYFEQEKNIKFNKKAVQNTLNKEGKKYKGYDFSYS